MVTHNRRELEAGEDFLFPRAVENSGGHDFVALVELGEAAIEIDVGGVLWAIVAVEVGGGIDSLAKCIVTEQGEVRTETLLDFEDAPFVESIGFGTVLIVLHDQWIDKALSRWLITWQTFDASQWIGSRRSGVPIAVCNDVPVAQHHRGEWSR